MIGSAGIASLGLYHGRRLIAFEFSDLATYWPISFGPKGINLSLLSYR